MITIISFGHIYGSAPTDATLAVDLREGFRNPAPHLPVETVFPDSQVRAHVLDTPGIAPLIDAIVEAAGVLAVAQDEVVVALGCAGGHHRAPVVAAEIGERLSQSRHPVEVVHRDLDTDIEPAPQCIAAAPDQELEVGMDDPIEMDEGAVDFALPSRPRSTEDPNQARARLEALAEAWTGGFQAFDLAQALADAEGRTRPRSWVLGELRRLEEEGRLDCDDYGTWTWAG